MSIRLCAFALLLISSVTVMYAQETVQEPSTGKPFPIQVTMNADGKEYSMKLTGLAVRKKFMFKVYGLAHYMQDPPAVADEAAYAAILQEGKAKHLMMDFARDVTVEQIQGAYRDGFEENATPEERKTIQPFVDQFLKCFTREVKENDKFLLTWLPGGSIIASVQGTIQPPIHNETFARVLWTIWFGEDSIVDREDLVSRMKPR
jgi:hypothetical protein